MKNTIKYLSILILLIVVCKVTKAQVTNTMSSGNWGNSSNWDNGVPSDEGVSTINHAINLNQDIKVEGSCTANSTIIDNTGGSQYKADIISNGIFTINANVTVESEVKFANFSSGSINSCSVFTTGNLLLENYAVLYIDNCSKLIINGNLTLKNETSIICDGEIIVNGNVEVSNESSVNGSGSLISSGDVEITNNASIFGNTTPCQSQSPPCSYGDVLGIWTGSINTDWANPGNWNSGFVPSARSSILIPNVANQPVLDQDRTIGSLTIDLNASINLNALNLTVTKNFTNSGSVTANNGELSFVNNNPQLITAFSDLTLYDLTINNSSGVTLLSGTVNLTGSLTLTRGLFTTNNNLTLISNQLGTARIGEITDGSIAGDITMQRYIDAGTTTWRYLTSAISGTTIADFNDNFFTTGFIGSNFPPSPAIPNPWVSIYTYDETTPGIIDSGFVAASNVTNPIGVGQGFWAWVDGSQAITIDVVGPPNVGDINLPVSYTNNGTPTEDGWSMVGNPYPSTLDWDSPNITKKNINNAIYIWNPDLQQYASYISGIGTNGGSRNIASSQAFWVQANSSGAYIQVTERSKTATDGTFLRAAPSIAPLRIKTENAYGTDELVINFEPSATANFDGGYDAEKIASSNPYLPRTSSILNGLEYSINQINPQEINIPVKILAGVTGTHTIRIENAYDFNPSSCLILEDLFTGTSYNLSLVDSFSTDIYDTTQTARFLLHIGAPIDLEKTDISCFSNTDAKIVFTKNSSNPFDIIWKDHTNTIISSATNVILADSLTNLTAGTYYIETTDALCGNHIDTVITIEPTQITAQFSSDVDTVYLSNGGMINFTNQSTNATSFNWDFDDFTTSNLVSPSHQYTQVGDYFVTLSASQSNDCFETLSKVIIIMDSPTAISETTSNNTLKVWVNNNTLLIKGNKNVTFDVRNVLGQVLFSATGNDQYSFDLSKLSSQMLIVNVSGNDNPSSIKVNFVKN